MKKSETILELKNEHLKEKIDLMRSLKGQDEKQQMVLSNSLAALTQQFFQQSNLTSWTPLLLNNAYAPITLNYQTLMYAYKTHSLLRIACNQPVMDALRGGLELECDELSPEQLQDISDKLESDSIYNVWEDIVTWTRLFGGAALVINAGDDPEKVLNTDRAPGMIQFYDATRWELGTPHRLQDFYNFYGQKIHWSRVVTMCGARAPWIIRQQLSGWGFSVMESMLEPFNIYMRTMNVIYELLNEAKVDVFRLKHYNSQLTSPTATNNVNTRIQTTNQLKSYLNAVVLDMDDEYTQKQIAFAGIAEMCNQARITLASALKMPITKLFGLSATGFNSGDDDIENYNSMIESEVRQPMKPMIRVTLRLLTAAMFGQAFDIKFKFKPLRVLSAMDEETVKTQKCTRYMQFYDKGLMTPKELIDISHKDGILPVSLDAAKEGAAPPMPPMMMGAGEEGGGGGGFGKDKEKAGTKPGGTKE